MRMTRLPGIHHDANCVVVQGEASVVLIDAGTSWYQALQVERILGLIDEAVQPEHLLLTSRRYPFSGAAAHFVERWPGLRVHVGEAGVAALETGDFFSTWANRYDSDMPAVRAEPVADMDMIALGDGGVQAIALPGHAPEGLGFLVEDRSTVVVGAALPRADLPARLDLPAPLCWTTWPASRVCSRLTSKPWCPCVVLPSVGPSTCARCSPVTWSTFIRCSRTRVENRGVGPGQLRLRCG